MFLKTFQNSQKKKPCSEDSFLIQLQDKVLQLYKKRGLGKCFFASFLQKTYGRLLLIVLLSFFQIITNLYFLLAELQHNKQKKMYQIQKNYIINHLPSRQIHVQS